MNRERWVSTCPVCGNTANTSRLHVRAKSGKVYYYLRFYHNPRNTHLLPTDSSYSSLPDIQKKARNLYMALEEYIMNRMGSRRYAYTSLKREIERFYGGIVHNEEFYRSVKKAISAGLLEKIEEGRKPLYVKVPEIELEEKVKYGQVAINYDFSNGVMRVSTFLEIINSGQIPLRKISYFVPYGTLDSLDCLNLQAQDENGEIPKHNLNVVFSASLKTVFSITLNRALENMEKDIVFLKYDMSYKELSVNFIAPAIIDSLRIGAIAKNSYNAKILRTLVDGIKETEIPFPKSRFCRGNSICFHTDMEHILEGESILIKLIKADRGSSNPLWRDNLTIAC